LERPQVPHSVVRLPEDSLPEQADGNEQQSSADKRYEQLCVDLGRQMADRAHETVVAAT
jgi:hypothetical protein